MITSALYNDNEFKQINFSYDFLKLGKIEREREKSKFQLYLESSLFYINYFLSIQKNLLTTATSKLDLTL